MFSEFHPLVGTLISNISTGRIIRNDIYDLQPLKQWPRDNICLIGDACHCVTPDMGQGGAQAIEDAYYLSNLIAKEQHTLNAFPKFQKKRYKKVNAIVKQYRKIAHWKYGKSFGKYLFITKSDLTGFKNLSGLDC